MEDRGDWYVEVHEVTKSWTKLSDWTTTELLSCLVPAETLSKSARIDAGPLGTEVTYS